MFLSPRAGIEMHDDPLTRLLLSRLPSATRRHARRGQIVPVVDPDTAVIVVEGAIAIEFSHREAENLIVDIVSPPSGVLNCRSLQVNGQHVMLRALTSVVFVRIPLHQLRRIATEDHECALLMAERYCDRVGDLRRRIAVLDEPDVRRRVLDALLYLDGKLATSCALAPGRILHLPQTVIASTAGISRQTANRVLRELQAEGLVRVERAMICLLEVEAIERLSRGERLPFAMRPCRACRLVNPLAPLECAPQGWRATPSLN